ncbi:mannitol dehydrogenase family protein [Celeribacter arenosi]|uniref:Mannitol dehydrogenase family protein n=1 Tax=Celeribacter arenosi TaxID=792649 RepID=A0ABP7KEH3_9RHOB
MSPENLPRLTRSSAPKPALGVVHLGLGAFYRAHGAIYLAEVMAKGGGDWGITGVSLKSPTQAERLKPQDCVYTALELAPDGPKVHHVEIIRDVLVAPENPAAVLATMADPQVKLVTLTVTEKGYCHNPATGKLNRDHPDIVADLANPDAPASALGFITRALAIRRAAGTPPFTVLTCDNLPDNGHVLRGVTLELATLIDSDLATWISENTHFPASMVDRIVPATKPEDIETVGKLTGHYDASPVMMEPFRQWVVEDDFAPGTRPPLDTVGVEMVARVTPYEDMKLRCLNGTHSSLAYLGYLGGLKTIAETVAHPAYATFVKSLWRYEIIPGLTPPPGVDLRAYVNALFTRYENPVIRHLTWQIAMDGSQKLPQRILFQLEEGFAQGRKLPGLTLAVAAWMRYVSGTDLDGNPIDVRDPMAERLKTLSDAADTPADKVRALLTVAEVFSPALRDNAKFTSDLIAAYEGLIAKGAIAMVEAQYA